MPEYFKGKIFIVAIILVLLVAGGVLVWQSGGLLKSWWKISEELRTGKAFADLSVLFLDGKTVYAYNVKNDVIEKIYSLENEAGEIKDAAYHQSSHQLAYIKTENNIDNLIVVNLGTGQAKRLIFADHDAAIPWTDKEFIVNISDFSPDGSYIAYFKAGYECGRNNVVRINDGLNHRLKSDTGVSWLFGGEGRHIVWRI